MKLMLDSVLLVKDEENAECCDECKIVETPSPSPPPNDNDDDDDRKRIIAIACSVVFLVLVLVALVTLYIRREKTRIIERVEEVKIENEVYYDEVLR